MPNFLAMSFEGVLAPSFDLRCLGAGKKPPDGWGIGWYPGGEPAASLLKEPAPPVGSIRSELVRAWEHLESSLILLHIRRATWGQISDANTQPFVRSFGGRDWMIGHSGSLDHRLEVGEGSRFTPVGSTDTELIFCELMSWIAEHGWRSIADIDLAELHQWLDEINDHGSATLVLSDGHDLVVYADRNNNGDVYIWEVLPPYSRLAFGDADLEVDLTRRGVKSRKGIIISTTPLVPAGSDDSANVPSAAAQNAAPASEDDSGAAAGPTATPATTGDDATEATTAAATATATVAAAAAGTDEEQPAAAGVADRTDRGGEQPLRPDPVKDWRMLAPGRMIVVRQGAIRAELAQRQTEAGSPPAGVITSTGQRTSINLLTASAAVKRLEIEHRTTYRYVHPVERSTHVLRLEPVHDQLQSLLDFELTISVDGRRRDYEDVFGNRVTRADLDTPFSELVIAARSRVELRDVNPFAFRPHVRTQSTIPLIWMPWQRHMLQPYLLPPELPETQLVELTDYAMSFVERNDHDLLETLIDMNLAIFNEYKYVQGATTLGTTPFDVYANRYGVCQDFANLFICMARLLSVPARYVCGYIYTGPKHANQVQSEASHAWVQLYLPEVGWRGFDPTNGILTQTDHVRVAHGRTYVDATPTSGTIFVGGGGETLEVTVRCEPCD